MIEDIPSKDVKEFNFRQLCKVRIGPSLDELPTVRAQLVAVSNKYGLLFAANQQGFQVLKTAELISRDEQYSDKANTTIEDFPFWCSVPTASAPCHLAVSKDDLTLSVCSNKNGLPCAEFYDIRAFAEKNAAVSPFVEVCLSNTANSHVVDLQWNPGKYELFASCTTDGALGLWEVGGQGVNSIAKMPESAGVTAISWSPKGKQVLVGKKDGTITQYDHAFNVKKNVPCPPSFQQNPAKVLDILWVSTYSYIAAFLPSTDDKAQQPLLTIINVPKNENPNFKTHEDVCYGSGEERDPCYYLSQLAEWNIVLGVSANATETAVLGKAANQGTWEQWNLDDAGRAECPMTADYKDTWPMGIAIDLTSQYQIPIGDEKTHPLSPLFVMMSTDGVLLPFWMMFEGDNVPCLTRPAEVLTSEGVRKPTGALGTAFPKPAIPSSVPPPSFTTPPAVTGTPVKTNLFGGGQQGATSGGGLFNLAKPLGQSTPMAPQQTSAAKPFMFGGTAVGGSLFGGITQPASASVPKPGGVLGNLLSKDPEPQSANPQAVSIPSATPQVSSGGIFSQFGGVKPSGGFTFGAAPAAPPPSTAPPSFTLTSKPVMAPSDQAESTKPAVLLAAKSQPGQFAPVSVATRPPPITSRPLQMSSANVAASTVRPQAKAAQPIQAQLAPTGTLGASLAADTSSLRGSPIVAESQPQSRTESPSVNETVESTFTRSIIEEMSHFEKELQELKARAGACNYRVGTDVEMQRLRKDTEEMERFCEEIKNNTKSNNLEIHNLKSNTLNTFTQLEQCRVNQQRNNEHRYLQLLRSRPLDPASATKMKELRGMFQYLDSGIADANIKLDREWEEEQARKKKKARSLKTPTTDTIYRTLSNNHNVAITQGRKLEQLMSQLQSMRLYNTTSVWDNTAGAGIIQEEKGNFEQSELASLADSFLEPKVSSPRKTSSPAVVSPVKQAKLREILGRRKVTPVKVTAPANLSMSKIISSDSLRKALARSFDSYDDESNDSQDSMTLVKATAARERTEQKGPVIEDITPPGSPTPEVAMTSTQRIVTPGVKPGQGPPTGEGQGAFSLPAAPAVSSKPSTTTGSSGFVLKTSNASAFDKTATSTTSAFTGSGFVLGGDKITAKSPVTVQSSSGGGITGTAMGIKPISQPQGEASSFKFGSMSTSGKGMFGSTPNSTSPAVTTAIAGKETGLAFGDAKSSQETIATASSTSTTGAGKSSILSGSSTTSGPVFGKPVSATTESVAAVKSTGSTGFTLGGSGTGSFTFGSTTAPTSAGNGSSSTGFTFGSLTTSSVSTAASTPTTSSTSGFTFGSSTAAPSTASSTSTSTTSSTPGFTFGSAAAATSTAASTSTSSASGFTFGSSTAAPASTATSTSTTSSTSGFTFGSSTAAPASTAAATSTTSSTPGFTFGSSTAAPSTAASTSTNNSTSGFTFSTSAKPSSGFSFGKSSTEVSSSTTTGSTSSGFSFGSTLGKSSGFSFGQTGSSAFGGTSVQATSETPTSELSTPSTSDSGSLGGAAEPEGSGKTEEAVTSEIEKNTSTETTETTVTSSTVSSASTAAVTSGGLFGKSTGALFGAGGSVFGGTTGSAAPTFGSLAAKDQTSGTSSTSSVFGGTPATATSSSVFGGTPATTSSSSVFGGTPATTSSSSVFGGTPATTTSSVFGGTATSSAPLFGSGNTTSSSVFGGTPATTTSSSSVFGGTSTSGTPLFGKAAATTVASTSTTAASSTSSSTPLFGTPATTTTGTSIFGVTPAGTTSSSLFGGTSSGSGVFGQPSSSGTTSTFGSGTTSGFGGSTTSAFALGGTLFGQTPASSSGGTAGFGSSTFGQSTGTSVFGVTPVSSSSDSTFGSSGGLFSGLGGKPSAENANKNVFGGTIGQTSSASANTSALFGQGGPSVFGTSSFTTPQKTGDGFGGGSFSAGGGNVATSGFGGFGMSQQQATGGFGSPPSFGGSPGFGKSPAFGSAPTFGGSPGGGGGFGSAPTFGSPLGGQTFGSVSQQSAGFAAFAGAGSPTFGALAHSSDTPGFGNLAQQGGGFGSAQTGGFGSPQTGGFGSPQTGGFGGTTGFGSTNTGSSFGTGSQFSSYR